MRIALTLLCAALLPAPALAESRLELEAALGGSFTEWAAPAVQARAGLDIGDWFTPSFRALAVAGQAAGAGSDGLDSATLRGYRAWAFFSELRLHTPTRWVQGEAALGVGLGQLLGAQCDCTEVTVRRGKVAPYGQLSLGARAELGDVLVGLEGALLTFTRVSGGNSWTFGSVTPEQEAKESLEPGVMLVLTVAWRGPQMGR